MRGVSNKHCLLTFFITVVIRYFRGHIDDLVTEEDDPLSLLISRGVF